MAGILDSLLPNFAVDSVAIYNSNLQQVLRGARPVKATVRDDSKLMEHPVEDGTIITDNKIDMPKEIDLSLILNGRDFQSVYQQISQLKTQGALLIVQTKTGLYRNMAIERMPHDEDPSTFDVVTMALSLKEVQFVQATYGTLPPRQVKKKTQASTVNRGQQQTTQAPARDQSQLDKWFGGWVPGK